MSGQQEKYQGSTEVPGGGVAEMKAAQWQIERENAGDAREAIKQGDKEAEKLEAARDERDPTYNPSKDTGEGA
ncbi:aminoacyl-tRNA hydrolase [Chlorella sorokiniana]|uniref:Aminoacyl-tRNA hydrolase n=1 Tax=Chlorella sorokiniana TaxID=3076 RepID=A0A2P6TLN2_CHLSO|nr:aminoacyl-tRNA hydrolase [Chlorella sorokiniana]|eukprot:PRW45190.1 aminoacyl-tRNA hydrolase [Chlorella sorokiniana]